MGSTRQSLSADNFVEPRWGSWESAWICLGCAAFTATPGFVVNPLSGLSIERHLAGGDDAIFADKNSPQHCPSGLKNRGTNLFELPTICESTRTERRNCRVFVAGWRVFLDPEWPFLI